MPTLYIKVTKVKDGSRRFSVKYRRGGGYWPIEHGGTFKTKGQAAIRLRVVGEWLAAGLDPKVELRRLMEPPVSMASACADWLASRRSVTELTRENYRGRLRRIEQDFTVAPAHLTVRDVNDWVDKLTAEYKPGTVALFVAALRQVLDHADVVPNPARDRRVELPRSERGEVVPPTAAEYLSVLQRLNARYRPIVVLLEQTGMRVSEAVTLEWGDVDAGACRFRVSSARSKTGVARWVEASDWVVEMLGPVGVGSAAQGRVFPGFTRQGIHNALKTACESANVKPFGPHALRHRRASILHNRGVPAAQAASTLGHSAQEHLRTYAHVMPVEEVAVADLAGALT